VAYYVFAILAVTLLAQVLPGPRAAQGSPSAWSHFATPISSHCPRSTTDDANFCASLAAARELVPVILINHAAAHTHDTAEQVLAHTHSLPACSPAWRVTWRRGDCVRQGGIVARPAPSCTEYITCHAECWEYRPIHNLFLLLRHLFSHSQSLHTTKFLANPQFFEFVAVAGDRRHPPDPSARCLIASASAPSSSSPSLPEKGKQKEALPAPSRRGRANPKSDRDQKF